MLAEATFAGDKGLLVIKTVGTLPDGLVESDTPLWSYRATGPQSVVFYFQLSVPSQGGTYDSRLASVSIDVIPADAPITDTPIPEPPAGRGATRPGRKDTAMIHAAAFAAALAALLLAGCATTPAPALTAATPSVARAVAPFLAPAPTIEPPRLPTATEAAALPHATYDAVIPGLIPIPGGQLIFPVAYRTDHDILLYRSPEARFPAAIMPAKDF